MLISEEQKRRYLAFWNRTPSDRACLHISFSDGSPDYPAPRDAVQKWEDLDYREAMTVYTYEHTRFYAEGVPTVFTNFGPGCLAACVGGSHRPSMHTIWFENQPLFIPEWEGRRHPVMNRESRMYRMIEDLSERFLAHGDLFYTSVCDIGGTYDILAALRGTENLLYDMYDNPDEIKALRDEIAPIWKAYFLEQSDRVMRRQGCMTTWMPIWSDKTYYPLQCDYSAMLSPAMFGEFILPDLREQTEYMDRAIYHLDGMGELPHVDQLLSLPRLNAIQWTSGDGKPSVTDPCWFDLYRRIQKAGKGVVLFDVPLEGLENMFANVSERGMFLGIRVSDEAEAKEVVRMAEKLNF